MRKKDIITLANTLRATRPLLGYGGVCGPNSPAYEQWWLDINAIVNACEAINPKFKREWFFDCFNGQWPIGRGTQRR
jgi:hypothetical protein